MAGTSLRMFFIKYDKAIGYSIFGILLFLLGWQTGRVMSPYYASSPIVFEDRQCSACPSSGGSSEALESLISSPSTSSTPLVPQNDSKGLPAGQAGVYVGSKNSTLFHHYTCASAKTIKAVNQVWFATYDTAVAAGRTPSACTLKLPK
ncbi:MAG: hypothetical protein A3C02_00535 [Candidatus Andersenbacteria bacterium RIFCSPHIGHO2_02_FULL_45_11]|uniref:Ada DNA repair metal-binding domain-containing protein n=1 Tax=Candidatus Andersenbacteria bacterium RIFCSPHIGHO2_12_FULL_45_11 TaxID=1797281 RepID=A0A1G1X270_9BACT|nr:MAG: hypothetical protein A2805_02485 [Candidatus Andersenbacteria bacterium RIFCSPHIGHO2_01_FULL_46_36]OGY31887.1 MAG: hypothetical protein A3C02_00535 [Candidatus Andersenbacteria bacterium RIFCSPHIGHO2_02_FULL_45_11]OGY34044.1 MAG: hypothetical protein A3D99_02185 [Candidatus Andersenbacteria bacterium RIFCSPHIGHO2_12_FULL_45_11]